jgi:hypothetical protein
VDFGVKKMISQPSKNSALFEERSDEFVEFRRTQSFLALNPRSLDFLVLFDQAKRTIINTDYMINRNNYLYPPTPSQTS